MPISVVLPLALRPFRRSLLTMPLLALQGCATAPLVSAPLPPMVVDQGSNRGVPADSSQHPPERDKANTADWFCAQGKRDADWQCIESSSPHPTADGAVPAGPSPNVSASPAVNPTRERSRTHCRNYRNTGWLEFSSPMRTLHVQGLSSTANFNTRMTFVSCRLTLAFSAPIGRSRWHGCPWVLCAAAFTSPVEESNRPIGRS